MIGVERGESKNRERLERWYKWGRQGYTTAAEIGDTRGDTKEPARIGAI